MSKAKFKIHPTTGRLIDPRVVAWGKAELALCTARDDLSAALRDLGVDPNPIIDILADTHQRAVDMIDQAMALRKGDPGERMTEATAVDGWPRFSEAICKQWLVNYRSQLNGTAPHPQPELRKMLQIELGVLIGEKSFRKLLSELDQERKDGEPALKRERGKSVRTKSAR